MAQIASEDYPNKLIYLHVDTVTNGWSPKLMQQEHRALRRLNAGGERGFDPMVTFSGNEAKGGGKFTPALTQLRAGVRIVPYDEGSGEYNLDILDECVNIPDGIADRDLFDRSGVVSIVNIDPTYSPVEIREVATGSALTAEESAQLRKTWKRLGLDPANPVTDVPGGITTPDSDVDIVRTGDGETSSTLTQQ